MSKNSVLSQEARESLSSRLASTRRPETSDEMPAASSTARFTDFRTLPGFEELRLQRSIGDRLGLHNPYFRMHDARMTERTRIDGREFLNFSSYDYLGLNGHPDVIAAAEGAIRHHGVSASASRHVAGERQVHRDLEEALADHYQADDALVFVSGYATNVSVIGHLAGPKDLVISDQAVHNSAVMGSVMSGAARRSFAHNDLDSLEKILSPIRNRHERVLIVVEGLYSMDGDYPDLPRLIEIKKRFNAWLMVDEAHALGVLGARGHGLFEQFGVDPREVDIWMGTLSKSLAGCGGYIAGCDDLVDYLRSTAGAFVYSVGMPPVIAASAEVALRLMHREPGRVTRLQENGRYFKACAARRGLDTGLGTGLAVVPVIVGDSIAAVLLSQELFNRGINVQPVLYPAVPVQASRLRFFVTAMHSIADIEAAVDATAEEIAKLPERMRALNARL